MVTVTVSAARVSPWVPPESVQGQCKVSSPPTFSSLSQSIFYLRGSLTETRWCSAPIAGDQFCLFKSSLIEKVFPSRYTICVQLCRLKQKIKSDPCSYPLVTFEWCTWGSLTAAKHSLVWGKLVLLFRAAFWVFMCWTFWLRVNFVLAEIFFCLSSTNLMRINKMNKVFLFKKTQCCSHCISCGSENPFAFLFQTHSMWILSFTALGRLWSMCSDVPSCAHAAFFAGT